MPPLAPALPTRARGSEWDRVHGLTLLQLRLAFDDVVRQPPVDVAITLGLAVQDVQKIRAPGRIETRIQRRLKSLVAALP